MYDKTNHHKLRDTSVVIKTSKKCRTGNEVIRRMFLFTGTKMQIKNHRSPQRRSDVGLEQCTRTRIRMPINIVDSDMGRRVRSIIIHQKQMPPGCSSTTKPLKVKWYQFNPKIRSVVIFVVVVAYQIFRPSALHRL